MDHNVPLCTFHNRDFWSHLTKQKFLHVTSGMVWWHLLPLLHSPSFTDIYKFTDLDFVLGHSYCIGGSVELLSIGVACKLIMKLGGWTSLCFLLYWRHLELIIPAAITHAWEAQQKSFAKKFAITNDSFNLPFDLATLYCVCPVFLLIHDIIILFHISFTLLPLTCSMHSSVGNFDRQWSYALVTQHW